MYCDPRNAAALINTILKLWFNTSRLTIKINRKSVNRV